MGNSEKETTENYTIRISNNAIQNINDITGFIAYIQHQPLNAIKVGDMIFDTIDKIEQNPLIFQI
jgi:plasmid stabilization system protein ParE